MLFFLKKKRDNHKPSSLLKCRNILDSASIWPWLTNSLWSVTLMSHSSHYLLHMCWHVYYQADYENIYDLWKILWGHASVTATHHRAACVADLMATCFSAISNQASFFFLVWFLSPSLTCSPLPLNSPPTGDREAINSSDARITLQQRLWSSASTSGSSLILCSVYARAGGGAGDLDVSVADTLCVTWNRSGSWWDLVNPGG